MLKDSRMAEKSYYIYSNLDYDSERSELESSSLKNLKRYIL
jgi:hypothetical protein